MRWERLDREMEKKRRVEEVMETLLVNRGMKTKKEREEFLHPADPLSKKFGRKLAEGELKKELGKAAKRIVQAIEQKEEIVVYGDYDADGICGTAILWETLHGLGAKVRPYIPERFSEGYGLNVESVRKLVKEKPELKLVITVDHGIVAGEKVKELGGVVDVIVTDHHLPGKDSFDKLGAAVAVVHTTEISGSGVAWVLASSLWQMAKSKKFEGVEKIDLREKLGLVAIGTVADLLPLVGANRSLVKWGMESLRHSDRPGIVALCERAGVRQGVVDTYEIGYMLAPRLNAMGRMKQAMDSLRLLCTKNEERAGDLAELLDMTNRERQGELAKAVVQAREAWLGQVGEDLIFLVDESYHEGIIGLVAGRLVEEFWLPAVVISKRAEYSKASARSIAGVNIIEVIREASDLLVDAGGHALAAGFTVETEKIPALAERLTRMVKEKLTEEVRQRGLRVDMELPLAALGEEMYKTMVDLAPFGVGNPQPVFCSLGVEIVGLRLVGAEGKHLKLRLAQGGREFEAMGFGMGEKESLSLGQKVDVAYNLVKDKWQGEEKLSLRLKDIREV